MTKTFSHPHFFRSVLRWLQVGYPEGVPGPDRVALLSLLRSTPLTEEQTGEVVRHFTENGSPAVADRVIDRDEIAEFISEVTHHDAGPENIQRVAGILAAAGWPLAGVDVGESESGSDRAPASQG
ncbi:DUF3349 domain-containing protein [Mycobacterium tuberculosis]|uniref:DUF3349 domain-containing protein n=1 Tax=Mycobacterium tuberculosis TaxID=1773 RepID=UPI0008A85C26|nr:DUF3349 domain-containing protein [Mycobacterium tuberculosis]